MLRAFLAAALLAAPSPAVTAAADQPSVVRAVLFFSPTCPHCHTVMEEVLPPLADRYGDALRIATVDVSTPDGSALYRTMAEALALPRERIGVPALLVGSELLVGSGEIPAFFPGLVEDGLERGGVDWPPLPALRGALRDWERGQVADSVEGVEGSAVATLGAAAPAGAAPLDRFLLDPVANGAAVAVLLLLLGALAHGARRLAGSGLPGTLPVGPLIPILAGAGVAVAAYLSLVEVTGAEAVCGPVGDCNAVQQSPWATLFGVPVGLLGVAGYLVLGGAWALATRARLAATRRRAAALFWVVAYAGTAFSAGLTFLEPFIIGASCAWCLTSALLMAALLWLATPEAAEEEGTGGTVAAPGGTKQKGAGRRGRTGAAAP